MKRSVCISILIVFLMVGIAFANDYMYTQQMRYYEHMKSCTSGTFPMTNNDFQLQVGDIAVNVDMTNYVYGKSNNKCHIREQAGGIDMHCYLPMDIARKYAEEGILTLKKSHREGSAYSSYMNDIINNKDYCSFK